MTMLKEKGTRCAAHVLTSDRRPSSGSGCELTNARQSTAVNVRIVNLILVCIDEFCGNNLFILTYTNQVFMITIVINSSLTRLQYRIFLTIKFLHSTRYGLLSGSLSQSHRLREKCLVFGTIIVW